MTKEEYKKIHMTLQLSENGLMTKTLAAEFNVDNEFNEHDMRKISIDIYEKLKKPTPIGEIK